MAAAGALSLTSPGKGQSFGLTAQAPKNVGLPTSVRGGAVSIKYDDVSAPYYWRPVQIKEHVQKTENTYMLGTYVNTLSMHVGSRTFEGATSHLIRVDPSNFVAKEALWCQLVGGTFVICRGVVVGSLPTLRRPGDEDRMRIGRLPVGMRPASALQFAALAREVHDVGGCSAFSSSLVTLLVAPDGWIRVLAGREAECAIDLSALRFCIKPGITLMDEVTLHTVDVGGSRLVSVQGSLSLRHFSAAQAGGKPLALFPDSCRPSQELCFVVTGGTGSFNLMALRPVDQPVGVGGELYWRDSKWGQDAVHVTGMLYEAAPCALSHSTLASKWNPEMLQALVEDFQNGLIRKFYSVEAAWFYAFDADGSGGVNFTEFGQGCKAIGYIGNITKLWAALDTRRDGEMVVEDFKVGLPSSSNASPVQEVAPAPPLPAAALQRNRVEGDMEATLDPLDLVGLEVDVPLGEAAGGGAAAAPGG